VGIEETTIAASHREAVEAVEGRLFANVLESPAGPYETMAASESKRGI
jgi:hypothetical protein